MESLAPTIPDAVRKYDSLHEFRSHKGGTGQMARIDGVDTNDTGPDERKVFAQQIEDWGVTLEPYEIYAHRPSIMHAVLGMWGGLKSSGLLERGLTTLVNRRVAALNGCVF